MRNILPTAIARAILDALKAASALLDGAVVKLFKNDLTPDSSTVLADFTEADFTGYAASAAIVWGTAYTDILGQAHLLGDLKTFAASGSATPNTVYGFYVVDGATLLYSQRFPVAIPINDTGDAVNVLPTFELKAADQDTLV